MKNPALFLMVASLLALGGQSFAELCTIDAVPAATLLLPTFEVDIGTTPIGQPACATGQGIDTLFSINNASAAPALAHVTLWTDWTWPTLDFDVYLTGYDVQSVSLCQVIGNGDLPITADVQNDTDDGWAPGTVEGDGVFDDTSPSRWGQDVTIPSCAGVFPFPPGIAVPLLDRIQNAHAGYVVPGIGYAGTGTFCNAGTCCTGEGLNGVGACVKGVCPPGTIARGYVTVDSVSECSTLFANEPDYFEQGGMGIANNRNVLWGEYFVVDRANNFAQGDNLVHIEASPSLGGGAGNGAANTDTGYTFYGRYTFPTGRDNREPLGTTWAARYLNGQVLGTTYRVWRDSTDGTVNSNEGWGCGLCAAGAGPQWCPLNETQVVCFDEEENCEELCFIFGGGVISPPEDPTDPVCFPLEANIIKVGVAPLAPSWPFGWCYLNLNHSFGGAPGGAPWPPGGGDIAQSYVAVSHDALGRFSVGYPAIELTGACSDTNQKIPVETPPTDPTTFPDGPGGFPFPGAGNDGPPWIP